MTGSASVAQSDRQAASRPASWTLMLLGSLAAASCIAAPLVAHYDATFQWSLQELRSGEFAGLAWIVTSACLWALSPGLCVGGLMLLGGRAGAAWVVTGLSSGLVLLWLAVDLRVDITTGKHALDYLRFLGGEEPWQWAGGAGQVIWPMLGVGGSAALGGVALIGGARWLSRRWGRSPAAGIAALATSGLFAGLLVGPIALAGSTSRPLVWMRLHDALPLSLPGFEVGAGGQAGDATWFQQLNQQLSTLLARHASTLGTGHPVANITLTPARSPAPNVILIVLESFRHDSIDPRWMPKLHAFGQAHALEAKRHYSTSHASHLGLFSLLFGRSPLQYEPTLDSRISAQLPHTLRSSGYRSSLLSSSALDWQRMDQFLSKRNFDQILIEGKGRWPGRDQRTIRHLRRVLGSSSDAPQFALVFLMSTHYNYQYPASYERHKPVALRGVFSWDQLLEGSGVGADYRRGLLNRYRNSLAFLDDLLGNFLQSIDLENNIVLITGDHGESFFDDGRWLHGSRLSDAQLRVPWLLAAPGIQPGTLAGPSTHLDVLPTLLHAIAQQPSAGRFQGRDLLTPPPDSEPELLLVGMGSKFRHLLLMRGERRMHLRLDFEGAELKTLGYLDDKGGYLPEGKQPEDDVLRWLDAVDRQFGALAP